MFRPANKEPVCLSTLVSPKGAVLVDHYREKAAEQRLRDYGGSLASAVITESPALRVELTRRKMEQPVAVHDHKEMTSIVWFRSGLRRFHFDADGQSTQVREVRHQTVFVVPAGSTVQNEYEFDKVADYVCVKFTDAFSNGLLSSSLKEPLVDLRDRRLHKSLQQLYVQASEPDNLFDLLSSSWVLRMEAHLAKLAGEAAEPRRYLGGLTPADCRRVEEYLRANYTTAVRVADLSGLTGLGSRHLIRAFSESFSETPVQYIISLRMERARWLLTNTLEPIGVVSIKCGFEHPHHFAAAFRKKVGCSPTSYRRITA